MSREDQQTEETGLKNESILMERPDPFIGVKTPRGTKRVKMLGVYYVHSRTADGGDLFVTKFGLPFFEHLQLKNWREDSWFKSHREKLNGTSTVYKVPSKKVNNRTINLVVKWCRVGEDVPLDTIGFSKFENAEFNTPFEEFSLVIEMRERRKGPRVLTNRPLAIYVPPEQLKLWQTGRSQSRVARKNAKHQDVELDILRQYILVYEWVDGISADFALNEIIPDINERRNQQIRLTEQATEDMKERGFYVVDHKPAHVVLRPRPDGTILTNRHGEHPYALVDFELLTRTKEYEHLVEVEKRKQYLNHQRLRFDPSTTAAIPDHLKRTNVLGVDYIWGHAESTHGCLWVVGRAPELFDYFLPERWRHTRRVKLSETAESYHTISKDHVKLVWKLSRVGEKPDVDQTSITPDEAVALSYNSPFEEISIAMELYQKGFSVVYPRAIYMSGLGAPRSPEYVKDMSRFESHKNLQTPEGKPILSPEHNFITVWGFWQGRIGAQGAEKMSLCSGVDLIQAKREALISEEEYQMLIGREKAKLEEAGFTTTLKPTHFLLSRATDGSLIRDKDGSAAVTISNFELIRRLVT